MVDRTVTTRLRLDTTGWLTGQRAAVNANSQLAASAASTAAGAQRDADRTAAAIQGTFTGMARAGQTALGQLDAAALRSSQALANSTAAMTRQTAAAAAAAARTTTQAGAATTASTRRIVTTAGEIPAAFRAAATAGASALGTLDVASAASRAQITSTLLAQRQSLTAAAAAVTQTSTGMNAATAAAAAGTNRLSLAARLALAEATQASRTAAAVPARISTADSLAASGARSAAAAAAAATARADANARALAGTFGAAGARARTMGSAVVTAAGSSEKSLKGARTASLLLVAALGLAVYASSKFETAMSGVKAATQSSGAELASLRQAAIDAGASTQYSATQAAQAETELAKAGVSTADILGGALRGTLSLAAAGEMDVADSAVVAAKAMNSFGLTGKDMAHIADVIAAAAGKSATDVHGMSLAFAQSSLLAHQTGLTLEQAAGSLALFAQNGLVGSDAGTSLKTMLMRLTPQSQQARDVMDKLGFSAYDASGRFIGWSATAQALQNSLKDLTPEARNSALGIIFGSDAIRAATIVSQAGAAGIDTWTKAANDQGYAARYAATQTDNLQGDVRRLGSALETALIQSGTAANGVLRDMAKAVTDAVRWYSSLPPEVQKNVTILGGLAGMIGLVASGLLLMLPRIMAVRTELVALGLTAERTRILMSGLGRLGVVVGVLTAMSYASDKISASFRAASPDVDRMTSALVDLAGTGKAGGEASKAFGDDLDGFGEAVQRIAHAGGLTKVVDEMQKLPVIGGKAGSLQKATDQLNSVDKALAAMVESGNADAAAKALKLLSDDAEKHGTSTKKLLTLLPQYNNALAAADTQQKLTAGSQKALGDTSEITADAIQDTRTETEKLTDALDALNGVNIDVATSSIDFQSSLADLKASVKDNGHQLDIHTDKGRKNMQSFLDAASAAEKNAEAITTQTGSQQAGTRALAANIEQLRKKMIADGYAADVVDKLLRAYAQVPGSVSTTVKVKDDSSAELEAIYKRLAALPPGKTLTLKAPSAAVLNSLKEVGYKVTTLPDHTVRISIPTDAQKKALDTLRARISAIQSKTVTLTIRQNVAKGLMSPQAGKNALQSSANGNIFRRYANGGTENHVAQIAPGGAWRMWAEPETGGEAYIPLAPGKRDRSRAIAEQTVRLLGGKGIAWYATGGISYTPTASPTLGGSTDAMDRYNTANDRLKSAWDTLNKAMADAAKKASALRDAETNLSRVRNGHHTATQMAAAEKKLTDARKADQVATRAVSTAKGGVYSADAALGVTRGARPPAFSLTAYQKQLTASVAATNAWRASLKTIAGRGGQEVADILEGMGQDGYALVQSLGKASNKQFADITKKLLATAGVAKASLADFDRQVNASTKVNSTFASDLQKLAREGYGSLAQALAAQGDDAAQALAHQAAGSSKGAAAANAAVKANANALTGDDLTNALILLTTLRSKPGLGFAALASAGLDTATVRALVPKIMGQIKALAPPYRNELLKEVTGQGGATAMARGGILTRPTAVVAAEAGHTESWIPWNGSARSAALLASTAAAMGYQLVPAGRFAGGSGAVGGETHVDRSNHIHLDGAQQSLGEQRADLLRHMTVLA
ncbi:phage tail tape measure protein [Streptomyces polygonati]|uniref:Phage tail tape measure protein n=1 Tax=Streptomyces polygonati TaxID=1617087 RepID=A0ABV8HS49_9ACTN